MILTHDIILDEINKGNIVISSFDQSCLGPASYDLSLGDTIRVFTARKVPFSVHDSSDFSDLTKVVKLTQEGYIMRPGEAILAITLEKIKLAPNIAGWLEGRSRYARMGLMVHISSPFISPGVNNQQVLEMANLSPTPLVIYPKTKICQMVFEYCEGKASYSGKFRSQNEP